MSDADLARRMERLERDNRRLKRGGLALVGLLAVLTTVYATRPVPQKITAHEFDLVDGAGRVRGMISVLGGEQGITLYDAQGKPRASMDVLSSGGPNIELNDAQGFRMDLGATSTETPSTGETQQTSAASIVMLGNDKKHHVIWQAP